MPLRQVQKRENVYIGIDPGASGGIAAICGKSVEVHKMPSTEKDLYDLIMTLNGECFAYLEQVGGYIGSGGGEKGGGAANGSAMFKFGYNVGVITGVLVASQIPFQTVTPRKWQAGVGISSKKKGETKTQWKNRIKQFAQRLYPGVSLTLATSDALLIATYCKMIKEQK